jgi:hypothetical protein
MTTPHGAQLSPHSRSEMQSGNYFIGIEMYLHHEAVCSLQLELPMVSLFLDSKLDDSLQDVGDHGS